MVVAVDSAAISQSRAGAHAARRVRGHRRQRIAAWILCLIGAALLSGMVVSRVEGLSYEPVLSGSMRPGIQPGDLAVLAPVPVSQLRVGEVVAYLPPNYVTPVMHRIVSLNAQGMITKGDANSVDDPWGRVEPRSGTVERLVTVVPMLGWLSVVKGQLLIVAAGLMLLVLALFLASSKRRTPPANGHRTSRAHARGTATTEAADATAAPSTPRTELPRRAGNRKKRGD